jgi:homoserine kinase
MAIADDGNEYFAGKTRFSLENAGLAGWQVREFRIDNEGTKII